MLTHTGPSPPFSDVRFALRAAMTVIELTTAGAQKRTPEWWGTSVLAPVADLEFASKSGHSAGTK